jgi:hypothetical protein
MITVTADGRGGASHAGSRLLADLGAATGLDQAFADAVGGRRQRRSAHDPGKVLVDLAVLMADGGEAPDALSRTFFLRAAYYILTEVLPGAAAEVGPGHGQPP